MKIKFLLLPEYGEQSKRKNEQIPLFFPLLAWRPCSGKHTTHFNLASDLARVCGLVTGPCGPGRSGSTLAIRG